jgi:hypothetical protein
MLYYINAKHQLKIWITLFVRNIIILLSLVAIFCVFYQKKHQFLRNDLTQSPAERQVFYRIGSIDPRFNLTEDEAKVLVHEAAMIWEQPLGRKIFFYHPNAAFKVNFIYDQRQQSIYERQRAERDLADGHGRNQSASANFQQQKSNLDDEFRRHNDELNELNARVNQHQQRVALVNSKGGATPSEAQALTDEGNQINQEVAAFNQNSTFLDAKQNNLKNQANAIQSQVNDYNHQADNYNQKFTGHPFEAGLYKGDEINIYEFDSKDNLRLILAHELGHSLGLKHSNDPQALMYPTLEKQDFAHFKLTQADIDLLYERVAAY